MVTITLNTNNKDEGGSFRDHGLNINVGDVDRPLIWRSMWNGFFPLNASLNPKKELITKSKRLLKLKVTKHAVILLEKMQEQQR